MNKIIVQHFKIAQNELESLDDLPIIHNTLIADANRLKNLDGLKEKFDGRYLSLEGLMLKEIDLSSVKYLSVLYLGSHGAYEYPRIVSDLPRIGFKFWVSEDIIEKNMDLFQKNKNILYDKLMIQDMGFEESNIYMGWDDE